MHLKGEPTEELSDEPQDLGMSPAGGQTLTEHADGTRRQTRTSALTARPRNRESTAGCNPEVFMPTERRQRALA